MDDRHASGTGTGTHTPTGQQVEEGEKKRSKNHFKAIRKLKFGERRNSTSGSSGVVSGFLSRLWRFFRQTWIDWLTLAAVGIVTGGVCIFICPSPV
jgi:hypothetical protein